MPYIKMQDRKKFSKAINQLLKAMPKNAGELNYLFSTISLLYVTEQGNNYQSYNDVIGALEGAKMELYRTEVVPYEDKKIKENGPL